MQPAPSSSEGQQPATAAFRSHLPAVLQSLSPSLSALHVARTRLLGLPQASQDAFASTHCPHCGAYMLDGDGVIRTVRKKGRNRADRSMPLKYVRRVCSVCGHAQDTRIDHGNASHYPSVRRRVSGKAPASEAEEIATAAALCAGAPVKAPSTSGEQSVSPSRGLSSRAPSIAAPAQSGTSRTTTPVPTRPSSRPAAAATASKPQEPQKSKSRPKKKSGLQDMLARNRERQERDKQAGSSGGLAAFLENL